jgi:hypothetical protein
MSAYIQGRDMIHFIVSFWGERFRQAFLTRCLPSLGEIAKHRLVIACPTEDWSRLCSDPRLTRATHLELGWPADQSDAAKFQHMTYSHRRLFDYVHRNRGLACQLMPDAVYSPGTVKYIEERARKGDHAVLVPAIRLKEDGLNADLSRQFSPRVCISRNLWPTYMLYDWKGRKFAKWPSEVHWHGIDQLTLHTSYFAYLLLDLSVPTQLDHSSFDRGLSVENRWLSDNFKDLSKIHVVQDDSVIVLSDTPLPETVSMPPHSRACSLLKGYRLRRMREYHLAMGDVIKADVMRYPIHYGQSLFLREKSPSYFVMRRYFGDVYGEFCHLPAYRKRVFWFCLRNVIKLDLLASPYVARLQYLIGRIARNTAHRFRARGDDACLPNDMCTKHKVDV